MPPRGSSLGDDEQRPLLHPDSDTASQYSHETLQVQFTADDEENPRAWGRRKKLINVAIIALMAILTPLASSMFTPGIRQIADDLHTTEQKVIATTTGFVIMMGFGPLVWAPLSEDFGRRTLYIFCFAVFTVLQAASAVSPNIGSLIAMRTVSGFFGSVGLANGGGTINDMYEPSQRAGIFGWYLLGPLLGPTLGPLFGGVIVTRLGWRWIYWILTIICAVNTGIGYLFLRETYAPVLLARRKAALTQRGDTGGGKRMRYYFDGEDDRPLAKKLVASMKRPFVIFVQPIVLTMSLYQALIFGTTYSIYTNMQKIYSDEPYSFSSEKIGLLYLGPGLGFLTSVRFLVPRIDTVFNRLTEKNGGKALPEFRLPLANVGSILIPASLFWFAWTVQYRVHWLASIAATYFYGIGQVVVFNSVQNYYIDSFSTYAASAIAGGSVFRSIVGGVVPLFAPMLFDKLGYGWGISCFGFVAVLIAPSPLLFYYFGERVRERFQITV
ncbi:putative transporter [Cladophialophora carrionii]|uniref:Putative transporter n=1 Tax=Cladophialophora carrionii TaxID=86049 RepID=A0A1C1CZL7_9EURO|nr:putative transporter [Cladophialophora carrionii]